MKKTLPLLLGGFLMVLANTGCMQDKAMDDKDINQKADSMYNARKGRVIDSMKNDCDSNMSAWIQMKADSIYNAESTMPK
ncbi:MAG TPA: hypothetical protein VE978_01595 [Chitinophagales bacterium]|nr:hypothetical protein [Chitinophagales bacterium]